MDDRKIIKIIIIIIKTRKKLPEHVLDNGLFNVLLYDIVFSFFFYTL